MLAGTPGLTRRAIRAVADPDPIERDRALLSLMLGSDRPGWVRRESVEVQPVTRRGGRRHALLTWSDELALMADCETRIRSGDQLTPLDVANVASAEFGKPISRLAVYRILRRHGWILVRRRPRYEARA